MAKDSKGQAFAKWKSGVAHESNKMRDVPYFTVPEGTSELIVLPRLRAAPGDPPFIAKYTHTIKIGKEEKRCTCNKLTELYGTFCIGCKAERILKASEDEDFAGAADDISAWVRFHMLVANYQSLTDGVMVAGFGSRVIDRDMAELIKENGDSSFWDPDVAQVMRLKRKGTGQRDTEYFGFRLMDGYGVGLDAILGEKKAKKLLEERFDLRKAAKKQDQEELLEYILEATDWNSKILGKLEIDEDDEEEEEEKPTKKKSSKDDDDDEDEAPKKKAKKPADDDDDEEEAPKKKAKKPADDDDDEDEAPKKKRKSSDDDDDEPPVRKKKPADDDDEEEEKPAKKRKVEDDEDEDEAPKKKRKPADDDEEEEKPVKKKASKSDDDDEEEEKPKAKKKAKDDDEDEDEPAPKKKAKKDDDDDEEEEKPKAKKKAAKDDDEDDDIEAILAKKRAARQAAKKE